MRNLRGASGATGRKERAMSETANPDCETCHGEGEYYGHSGECNDDMCALNGDFFSCHGEILPCGCSDE